MRCQPLGPKGMRISEGRWRSPAHQENFLTTQMGERPASYPWTEAAASISAVPAKVARQVLELTVCTTVLQRVPTKLQ